MCDHMNDLRFAPVGEHCGALSSGPTATLAEPLAHCSPRAALQSTWSSAACSQWQFQQQQQQQQLTTSSSSSLAPCSTSSPTGLDKVDVQQQHQQQRCGTLGVAPLPAPSSAWMQQLAADWLEGGPAAPAAESIVSLPFADTLPLLPTTFEDCFAELEDAGLLPGTSALLGPQDAGSRLHQLAGDSSAADTPTFAGHVLTAFDVEQQQQQTAAGGCSVACGASSLDGSSSSLDGVGGWAATATDDAPPPRRKRGRPRLYDTSAAAAAASAPWPTLPGAAEEAEEQRRSRGPKPKYVFPTHQEALGARRERNRKAALESYYKKKERKQTLEAEADQLRAENAALEMLLAEIEATGKCPLLEATEAAIDIWLAGTKPE